MSRDSVTSRGRGGTARASLPGRGTEERGRKTGLVAECLPRRRRALRTARRICRPLRGRHSPFEALSACRRRRADFRCRYVGGPFAMSSARPVPVHAARPGGRATALLFRVFKAGIARPWPRRNFACTQTHAPKWGMAHRARPWSCVRRSRSPPASSRRAARRVRSIPPCAARSPSPARQRPPRPAPRPAPRDRRARHSIPEPSSR